MGELDTYTFLESSDHVDNRKNIFFITFGATSFPQQFSIGNKRHIYDLASWIYLYIQLLVSVYFINICSVNLILVGISTF